MIVNVRPDRQKSQALRTMAEITLERLKKTDMQMYPSNTLVDYYDAIHKLLEALALNEGVKVKGEGAHAELIDYISGKHSLGLKARLFLQQMRDYRNRIAYEGFRISKNYIVLNSVEINGLIDRLLAKL